VKRSILTSRVGATTRVVDALRACTPEERPTVLVSSSAVGYYGTSSSLRFDESSASGSDYLSKVCREWEAAAAPAASLGARVVVLRMGIVLDKGGGALASMAPVFQLFAGGPLGDGRQFFSWVHRDDAVSIICRAMQDASVSGAYNVTAPRPVRMGEFCQSLGAAMGRPAWLPVPEFAVQALLGEGAKVRSDQRARVIASACVLFHVPFPGAVQLLTRLRDATAGGAGRHVQQAAARRERFAEPSADNN
jgi:uncharacterized protein (TIGR01777 family)